jgi:ABC-type transport system substrate-binding protein
MIKLSILILSLLIFSNCRKVGDNDAEKNILQVPLKSDVDSLDPARSYDTVSGTIVYQVLEQLYQYSYLKRPFVLEPLLAEGMPKIENNGTRYIIKIKKNIRYHDHAAFKGQPRFVIAEDFINEIKRLAFTGLGSNGWWLFDGKIKGLNEFREKAKTLIDIKNISVTGLQAPDDQTLIIDLTSIYPQMIYALAMSFVSPVPWELIEFKNNFLNDTAIGTGPFYITEYAPNTGAKTKRFPHYHEMNYPSEGDRQAIEENLLKDAGKRLPFLDGVNFTIIKESQTTWLNFLKKKIDYVIVPKDNYASILATDGGLSQEFKADNIQLTISPTLIYWWLSFNMKDSLLGKNKLLREAIAHAVDVERYINTFTNNVGLKANSIYPPGIPGYNPTATLPYKYDPQMAQTLLAKAGFPGGKGLPVLNYDVRGSNTTDRQQAEFVKGELEKIGIKVNVGLNTFPAFLEKSRQGKLQFWQDGWAMDYPDAENSLQLLISKSHAPGPNSTYYSNPKVDQLFNKLAKLNDGAEKFKIMQEIEQIVHGDLPWIMQYYERNYIVYHGHVKNYRPSTLVNNFVKYIKLQKP